jgi:hypothetical protein
MTESEISETAELMADLSTQYDFVRMLPDGSLAGLSRLAFTTGIFLGMTREGWGMRFCFEDPRLALQRFAELQSEDDEPAGYIATRRGLA